MTQKQEIGAIVESLADTEKAISDSIPRTICSVRNRNGEVIVVDPQAFHNTSIRLLRTISAFRGNYGDTTRLNDVMNRILAKEPIDIDPETVRASDRSIWTEQGKRPYQGNVNDLAEKCWEGAFYITSLEGHANQEMINKSGTRYVLGNSFFYITEINLLNIAVACRGAAKDYQSLGITQAKFSDDVQEASKRTQLANEAIHNLEQAIRLGNDYRAVHHNLGLAYSIKGKNLDWDKREGDYMNALKHLNKAQKMGEKPDTQELIVDIQSELAEETIYGEAKINWYKKAVNSAKKLIDMRRTASDYYRLGMLQVDFSEELYSEKKDNLKRDGLINLKISYRLENDQTVLEKIKEIEAA